MEDISKITVVETLDTAKEYASKLEDLIKSVEVATQQVCALFYFCIIALILNVLLTTCNAFLWCWQVNTSTQQAIEDIDNAFSLFTSVLVETLNKRRSILKAEALKFREDGLIPLKACHDLIAEKLKSTQLYIEEGHDILRVGGCTSAEESLRFSEKASELGRLVKFKVELQNTVGFPPCHVLG